MCILINTPTQSHVQAKYLGRRLNESFLRARMSRESTVRPWPVACVARVSITSINRTFQDSVSFYLLAPLDNFCRIGHNSCRPMIQLAGLVAASEVAKASSAALTAMVSQEHGKEGVVLDAWLTLGAHKVSFLDEHLTPWFGQILEFTLRDSVLGNTQETIRAMPHAATRSLRGRSTTADFVAEELTEKFGRLTMDLALRRAPVCA